MHSAILSGNRKLLQNTATASRKPIYGQHFQPTSLRRSQESCCHSIPETSPLCFLRNQTESIRLPGFISRETQKLNTRSHQRNCINNRWSRESLWPIPGASLSMENARLSETAERLLCWKISDSSLFFFFCPKHRRQDAWRGNQFVFSEIRRDFAFCSVRAVAAVNEIHLAAGTKITADGSRC